MSVTITKTAKGFRIQSDGYSKFYGAYEQGAIVCDVSITAKTAYYYGIDVMGNGDIWGLVDALRRRIHASKRERAEHYSNLKGAVVREMRKIQ